MFFCTSSKVPLTFRAAQPRDALGSPLRRHVLGVMHDRELRLELIRATDSKKYILTDTHNSLGKLQEQESLHHWSSAHLCPNFDLDPTDQVLAHSNEKDLARCILGNLLNIVPRVIYFVIWLGESCLDKFCYALLVLGRD